MLALHWTTALLLGSSLLRAQLVIENPKHLEVPEQRARTVFQMTMRVMEKEFHAEGSLENAFRMRLVLGEKPERFTIDDASGNGTVYMERWNEGKFAITAMRLSVQHLLVPKRQQRLLEDIMRRTHEVAPVTASQLREESSPPVIQEFQDSCINGMTNAAVHTANCLPAPIGRP